MSLFTSLSTWLFVLFFGGAPLTGDSPPPPPTDGETTQQVRDRTPGTVGKPSDRIYVGF